MRWYNPKTRGFEWRSVPGSDEEALHLLEGLPAEQAVAEETYREWRWLGASVMAALILSGRVRPRRRPRSTLEIPSERVAGGPGRVSSQGCRLLMGYKT